MLSGGYNSTMDDKGRFTFPARLRDGFAGDALVVTRGLDRCLCAYPQDKWEPLAAKLENANSMLEGVRRIQRNFLGWAVTVEFDKLGRLAVPQALREWANLKRDCVVMGLGGRIEIWDADTYNSYSGEDDENGKLTAAAEEFAGLF